MNCNGTDNIKIKTDVLKIYIIKKQIMDIQTRILQPQTIISIVSSIFCLGVVWATLNGRIKALEEFKKTVDIVDINLKLGQIQADLDWIKRQREQHHK